MSDKVIQDRSTAVQRLRRQLLAGSGIALSMMLTGCDWYRDHVGAKSFNSTDISATSIGRHLEMPDADGRMRALNDWKGDVVVIFFGYTQCPDVCPTTLAEMAQFRQSLGQRGERLQSIFVTVDPERDTPEILKAYMANFGPGMTALRGSPEQTAAAAKEFGISYRKVPGSTPGSYTMDHSAVSMVFDKSAHIRLLVRFGSDPKLLESDLKRLIDAA